MNRSGQFNSHVFLKDLDDCQKECSPVWNKLIGTLLLACTIFGVPANILALKYFRSTRSRKLPNLLYQAICSIDTCTCVAHIPVAISLLNDRYPVSFNNMAFCATWYVLFTFLQSMSMFLVMILSVSRCIAIALPFQNVRKSWVISAIPLYSFFLMVQYTIIIALDNGLTVYYGPSAAQCFILYNHNIGDVNMVLAEDSTMEWYIVYTALMAAEAGIPPVVTLISFVICAVKLLSKSEFPTTEATMQGRRRSAMTVTMFTGLFLLCNLPFFINMTLETFIRLLDLIESVYNNNFWFWYSWVIYPQSFSRF